MRVWIIFSKLEMIFNYICLSVHTWDAWVCLGMCVEVRGPQFSPFMLWILGGANSGFQVWHKFLLPTEPFCQLLKCFNLFFINYFIHLHSKYCSPFLVLPPQILHPIPLFFASERVFLYLSTHSHLSLLASPFPGALSFYRIKFILFPEARQDSPLLPMYQDPQRRPCMLFH